MVIILFRSKIRNYLRKPPLVKNRKKLSEADFPTTYSKRKWFCFLLMYFTSIIEPYMWYRNKNSICTVNWWVVYQYKFMRGLKFTMSLRWIFNQFSWFSKKSFAQDCYCIFNFSFIYIFFFLIFIKKVDRNWKCILSFFLTALNYAKLFITNSIYIIKSSS